MRGYPVQGCQGQLRRRQAGHVKGELWPAVTRAGRHVWHEAPKTGRAFTAEINMLILVRSATFRGGGGEVRAADVPRLFRDFSS